MNIINNSFIPLNKNKFLNELRKKGIPDATIDNINWLDCIEDGYCIYNNKKTNKTCLTKIQNKNNKLCSIHKKKKYEDEINEIGNMLKNINIDKSKSNNVKNVDDDNNIDYLDSISETYCSTEITNISSLKDKEENHNERNINCFHLDESGINNLSKNLNILLNDINDYKKGSSDITIIYKSILNFNKNLYNLEEEPYICMSLLLQFFEELYETSNCFLNLIIDNYENFNIFINLCQKWKIRIKEITTEMNLIPDYYQEYYTIINKKIDTNLFKILNSI
jgi:hypothetical protein